MENVSQSRRKFIAAIAVFCASAGMLWRYLTPRSPVRRQVLLHVSPADIPPNGALIFRDQRLALLRDERGAYALSLVCTHLGCTVIVSARELVCPCHGSRFDRQGKVLNGPADRSLKRMQVEERADVIEVLG